MGSSVRVPGAGQSLQTPEGTAVAQVREVAEGLKRVTLVVAGVARALLVDLAGEEASVRRAFAARRAAVLLPGAVGHPAAVAVEAAVVVAVEAAVVVAVVAGEEDVGEQEIEKNKY